MVHRHPVYICLQIDCKVHTDQTDGIWAYCRVFGMANLVIERFLKLRTRLASALLFSLASAANPAEEPLSVLSADVAVQTSAQSTAPQMATVQDSRWTLGIAAGHGQRHNPFVASDDFPVHVVLDIAWYGERVFFDNGDLGVSLQRTADFSFNLVGTFDNERNYYNFLSRGNGGLRTLNTALQSQGLGALADMQGDLGRDELLSSLSMNPGTTPADIDNVERLLQQVDNSLPRRQFAVNGGLELLYLSPLGDIQAQFLNDISGRHHGQSALLSWSHPWTDGTNSLALTAGAEWRSDSLVDYYYGVQRQEAFPGRPQYQGRSAINPFVRLAASHALNSRWKLTAVAEHERLGAGIRQSPIIERDSINTFFVGLYYQF